MGAKHVADIVRALAVGLDGRVGRRVEGGLREDALVEKANNFFDVLLAAFPPLEAVADGKTTTEELRTSSLLGSAVMLRVLAGVYAELADKHAFDDDDTIEFFTQLAPHMASPVTANSIWVTKVGDEVFSPGASAPRSRRQDLKTLRDAMVEWATAEPAPEWLNSPAHAA
jgi:hypothetical protein